MAWNSESTSSIAEKIRRALDDGVTTIVDSDDDGFPQLAFSFTRVDPDVEVTSPERATFLAYDHAIQPDASPNRTWRVTVELVEQGRSPSL